MSYKAKARVKVVTEAGKWYLAEIKALCYITGENYDAIPDIRQFLYDNEVQWGTWFNWAFFRVKGFKKGTMHFEFLDEKVWMMFNQAVAEQRGWVLPKKRKK